MPAAMNTASATQRSHNGPSMTDCAYTQPTTTGMAAIRATVRIFGMDRLFGCPLVVAMFIRLTNTGGALRSTLGRTGAVGDEAYITPNPHLAGLGVEKLEDLAGAFGADPRNLAEVGDRGPFDLLQGSEVVQQGTFA